MNKTYYILNLILLLLFALILSFAAVYDLEVSKNFVNQSSSWANVIEDFGEIPGIITILTAILIYHKSKKYSSNIKSLSAVTLFTFSTWVLFSYISYLMLKSFSPDIIPFPIIGFVLTFVSIVLINKSKLVYSENAILFSKVVLRVSIIGYLFIIHPIKIFWERIRFRDLNLDFSDFTIWFQPNGITGNESFPSGHSAMAWMMLTFIILLKASSKAKQFFFLLLLFGWGLLVSASRIVIGAHYLSDVTMSCAIIILLILYSKKSLQNNQTD